MKTKKHEYLPVEYYRIGQEVQVNGEVQTIKTIYSDFVTYGFGFKAAISNIKPVLRRMESMTEEEKNTYLSRCHVASGYNSSFWNCVTDWLDEKGFDRPRLINGVEIESLIDAGQAVDAKTLEGGEK